MLILLLARLEADVRVLSTGWERLIRLGEGPFSVTLSDRFPVSSPLILDLSRVTVVLSLLAATSLQVPVTPALTYSDLCVSVFALDEHTCHYRLYGKVVSYL